MKKSDPPLPLSSPARARAGRATRASLTASFWPFALLLLLWPIGSFLQNASHFDPYFARIICLVGLNITLAVSLQLINGISGQFSLGHAGFMAVGAYMAAYPAHALLATDAKDAHIRLLNNPLAPLLFYLDIAMVALAVTGALALLFLVFRLLRKLPSWAMALGLLLVAAWIITDMASGSSSDATPPLYLLWSSLNYWLRTLFGATLEHGLPMTHQVGAMLPGPVAHLLKGPVAYFLTCLVLLIGGGLCAAGGGLIIGIPVLRLRGDYLAIATLGFAEIIAVLINNSEPLGGALGLSDIPRFAGFGWIYGVAILTTIAVWRLTHSARGRAMLAVREDEVAASAIGIDPARSRILAFVVGAFFAGVAGALFAHFEGYITPRHFQFMRSIELVVMVTLAGAGSLSGTILAAIVLTLMPELLRSFSEWRMVIYSLLLIIMMLLRPEGLLGGRELIPRFLKKAETD